MNLLLLILYIIVISSYFATSSIVFYSLFKIYIWSQCKPSVTLPEIALIPNLANSRIAGLYSSLPSFLYWSYYYLSSLPIFSVLNNSAPSIKSSKYIFYLPSMISNLTLYLINYLIVIESTTISSIKLHSQSKEVAPLLGNIFLAKLDWSIFYN